MKGQRLIAAGALTLAYWLLAGQASISEALALVMPLAAALVLSVAAGRATVRPLHLRAPWMRLGARTGKSICKDSIRVAKFLARSIWQRAPEPKGSTLQQPFTYGDDSPSEAGRRALVVLSISASPDRYVLDLAPDEGIRAHSLAGASAEPDPRWPV